MSDHVADERWRGFLAGVMFGAGLWKPDLPTAFCVFLVIFGIILLLGDVVAHWLGEQG